MSNLLNADVCYRDSSFQNQIGSLELETMTKKVPWSDYKLWKVDLRLQILLKLNPRDIFTKYRDIFTKYVTMLL